VRKHAPALGTDLAKETGTMKVTIPKPRGVRPPTDGERLHAIGLYDLQRAVRGVLAYAAPSITPAERTAVLTEALTGLLLASDGWCRKCQAAAERICCDHVAAVELSDASRRHAYRQLPGRPRIDVDL
jgi:hypothetical protein